MLRSLRRHWRAWRAGFDRCTEGVACGHRRRVHGRHGCGADGEYLAGLACQALIGGTVHAPLRSRHDFNGEEWPQPRTLRAAVGALRDA